MNWNLYRKALKTRPGAPFAVAAGVALALSGKPALGAAPLPTGGVITSGAGSIRQTGSTLTVNQSSQALVANWQSFDIGVGKSVNFQQPNSSSVALNRVIGPDASFIYGSLTANGKIFLVNPNGVLFAPSGQVSVGSLVVSSLDISTEDFATGHYRFSQGSGASGAVTNEGTIQAGSVVLIGPQVTNSGSISTPGGNTTLAAGQQVTVQLLPDGLMTAQVDVAAANAQIQNHGRIEADGGSVSLLAGRADAVVDTLINTDGVVEAHSIRNENGQVYLDGGAGGTVTVSGAVDVSGTGPGARGGSVTVLGKNVGLMAGATVNASGDAGGGTVLIGGNWQGSGSQQAQTTYMDAGATIAADAAGSGNGGEVVLWSNDHTAFLGQISARGGALGGHGGEVETSSRGTLVFDPAEPVDTRAPNGDRGTLLLDPLNISIVSGTGGSTSAAVDALPATVNGTITDGELSTELASSNVVLTAANTISDTSGINVTGSGSLTMNAANITLTGKYSVSGGMALNITGTGSLTGNGFTGSGAVAVTGGSWNISESAMQGVFSATNATVSIGNINAVSSATFTGSTLNLGPGGSYTFGSQLTLDNTAVNVDCGFCGDSYTSVHSPVGMIGNNSVTMGGNQYQQGLTFMDGFVGSGNVTLATTSGYRSLLDVYGPMANFSGTITASTTNAQPYWVQINSPDGWGTGTLDVTGGNVSVNYEYNTDFRLPYYGSSAAVNEPTAKLIVSGGTFTTGANMTIGAVSGAAAGTIDLLSDTSTASTLTTGLLNDSSDLFAGIITGPGNFIKTGTGTQILTGNNTYTGTTTVSGGTLQVGNGGTTGTLGTGVVADNGNLVFDRSDTVNLSTMAANAAGITGTGNVSALIGGGFTVDRPIALTGAGSGILLEAGDGVPAGNASGGDVTLSVPISTTSSGTVTIFSGNANTAALDAQVSGANGPTRYKSYDAAASATSGAVAGTRNYYYREDPVLSVSGITASKTYDGLVDATAVLDGSAATVTGAIEGDSVSYTNLFGASASFGTAHVGSNIALNASFAGATGTNTAGGVNWAVSGYSIASYSADSGTITPRPITVAIDPVNKTYDGLTDTTSMLGAPAGFAGNDSATGVSGFQLAFGNPNVGTRDVVASGTGSLVGFTGAASGNGSGVGAGNEVAGLASDYIILTPSPASAVISPALLTITANNDAKIVTQTDSPGYNGVSYSGFVDGQGSSVLTGTLSITRSNAGVETAGTYSGVLVPAGLSSSNYAITYVNGAYQILPAQELLVSVTNVTNAYGTSPAYAVTSAQYLAANGTTIHNLTETAQSGNTYTFSDGVGGTVTFTVTPQGAITSDAGYLAVGNYALGGANTSIAGNNFGSLDFIGNQTVTPIGLTPVPSAGVSKVYDGTDSMTGLSIGLDGLLAGDAVGANASGAFSTKDAGANLGYDINGIALSGADAGDYYLTAGSFAGNNGVITPKPITVSGVSANSKVYDGTTADTLTTAGSVLDGVISGDSVSLDASSYSALFANRNVGSDKPVTVTGLALSGAEAEDYTLAAPTGLTASITPRTFVITAAPNTKPFDGTTTAAGVPSVSGSLAPGDSFGTLAEAYTSPAVGSGITMVPVASVDDGNGGLNYTLEFVDSNTGTIRLSALWTPGGGGQGGGAGSVGGQSAAGLSEPLAGQWGKGDWRWHCADRRWRVKRGRRNKAAAVAPKDCFDRLGRKGILELSGAGMRLPPGLDAP